MSKTTRDPATFGQARAMTCGWCGAELMQSGGPRMEPRRVGDFFCPDCMGNNAPCCQCGERDCYLLPSGECPNCTHKRAEAAEVTP